jgi:hypothetical protein
MSSTAHTAREQRELNLARHFELAFERQSVRDLEQDEKVQQGQAEDQRRPSAHTGNGTATWKKGCRTERRRARSPGTVE